MTFGGGRARREDDDQAIGCQEWVRVSVDVGKNIFFIITLSPDRGTRDIGATRIDTDRIGGANAYQKHIGASDQ